MAEKKSKPSHNEGIIGDVKAKNLAVGKGAKAEYHEHGVQADELSKLYQQLFEALATVAPEKSDEIATIKEDAEALKKAAENGESPQRLEIKANRLKEAAAALKDVTPSILAIAGQIIAFVLKPV
jgi:hypothetical protein